MLHTVEYLLMDLEQTSADVCLHSTDGHTTAEKSKSIMWVQITVAVGTIHTSIRYDHSTYFPIREGQKS